MKPFFQVGNTPLGIYNYNGRKIYIKLEAYNPSGSMKDRAAVHILEEARKKGIVNEETTIIESSSGNFGVALAMVCKAYGLKFICVIDKNTNRTIEELLKKYDTQIIKITEADDYGGYLLNRLKKVKEILTINTNIYWINQYENILNAESYSLLADELLRDVNHPDYIFIPVSSGGTITGISRRIKEKSPNTKIIAVDSQGSIIFGGKAQKRHIPGMGSSIVPPILKYAQIDDVSIVDERDMVGECRKFFNKSGMMIGGSSGACLIAIERYCNEHAIPVEATIVTVFPDRGERYSETIYNQDWCELHYNG
mgnify:CR=1 FL=1